jgi:hypothetical protein
MFYGIILGLTVFLLLSITVFACCDKLSCRYLLYVLGFILFLAALAAFAIFFFLSYASAIFYSGCHYLSESINNPSNFIGISEFT